MKNIIRFLSVYFFDKNARFNAAILLGLIFNGCYIVFNLVLGILQENAWYITVAAYYTLIVILRYLIIDGGENSEQSADAVSKLLLLVAFPLTGMIIYTIVAGAESKKSVFAVPIFAVYAAFGIFRAIYGLIISGRDKSSARRVAHTMRLSQAFLSLFNFQTSLLSLLNVRWQLVLLLNFITGGCVSIATLALAASSKRSAAKGADYEKI